VKKKNIFNPKTKSIIGIIVFYLRMNTNILPAFNNFFVSAAFYTLRIMYFISENGNNTGHLE